MSLKDHVETMARSVAAKHPAVTGVLAVLGTITVLDGIYRVLSPKPSTAQPVTSKAVMP